MPTIQATFKASLFSLLFVISEIALSETYGASVVGVSDGDTITVLDSSNTQHKVRLAGIDAPEKSQAFGQRARDGLSALVFGKPVVVDSNKRDRYGREIGKVIVGGQDANLSQVRMGLAWHYKAYEKEQSTTDRAAYAQAEIAARSRRAGLWQESKPTPPWDFRHGSRDDASLRNRMHSGGSCACGSGLTCTGPKGGIYCMTVGGAKKYQ
ncbi:thermonuclease family protein [Dechloromonas hortensis]|uniref:thermonuclease family protein n=1 Tax=Dechloromonas hortensis TaxID=337779 RepID=UPI0012927FDF|nr:thermonuclease family protein [Dechloromonas hortensis]